MKANTQLTKAITVAALLVCAAAALAAGDPDEGQQKARTCAACHGLDGRGRIPLADKTAGYLEEQLRAFRNRTRSDETMNAIAKQLDDQDIADLAAYYASQ